MLKYGNRSKETEVLKWEKKPPICLAPSWLTTMPCPSVSVLQFLHFSVFHLPLCHCHLKYHESKKWLFCPFILHRSQATQSSLPPSLHSSRAHSPDGSTSQHSKIEPPSQPVAQRDFSQHHVSGSDRVAPPQTSVDKSTGGQGLRATKTKSSERVRSGVKPISGERHMKSQSSKQGRKRKSQESSQTK